MFKLFYKKWQNLAVSLRELAIGFKKVFLPNNIIPKRLLTEGGTSGFPDENKTETWQITVNHKAIAA
jgi:hypothetical protein